jgi:ribose transport system substrate-binding protein
MLIRTFSPRVVLAMSEQDRRAYLIDAVVRAQRVLDAFAQHREPLRLRDVIRQTGMSKNLCFRLLYTLRHCGVIEKVDVSRYRLVTGDQRHPRYRIGYADQIVKDGWLRMVNAGLIRAAEQANIELILVSNRRDPKVAVRNARQLVRENPDLIIEFQIDESVAPAVAAQYIEAGIPAIAVDVPHPGATFFGANNHQAGFLGGRHLGRWVKSQWHHLPDEIILIGQPRAGSVVASRVTGVLTGVLEVLPELEGRCPIVHLDGDGQFKVALERVRHHLCGSKARHVLVGCVNDASALAAVRAFQEAGREEHCAVVGQNAEPDGRTELRRPKTPLVASVGYFPERYGDALIRLALDILRGKAVPPAVFIKHQVITRENVDHFYPNDALTQISPSY